MYESKQPYFYGTGRRKHSVARVRVYEGTGKITINGRDIDDYFGLETLKLIVRQPFAVTDTMDKYDIVCTVTGGGVTGQAGASDTVFQELFFRLAMSSDLSSRRKASSLVTQE